MQPEQAVAVNRRFHDHECTYYDQRFAIRHDAAAGRRATAELTDLLGRPLRAGERVLDVGCGTGWLAAGVRRLRPDVAVFGVDLSAGMLTEARRAGAWPLVQAEADRLPLPAGSLQLVVARGVLHHLPEVASALREWRRVLAPGGAVVLTSEPTPAVDRQAAVLVRALLALLRRPLTAEEDFWELAAMAANLHVFTPADLRALAQQAGYRQVELASRGWLSTFVLTASYVTHGRRQRLARRLPWHQAEALAARLDALLGDRVLPARWRHTVAGVLRP